jgi:hypothetical protein
VQAFAGLADADEWHLREQQAPAHPSTGTHAHTQGWEKMAYGFQQNLLL